jgi:hypothetical protein
VNDSTTVGLIGSIVTKQRHADPDAWRVVLELLGVAIAACSVWLRPGYTRTVAALQGSSHFLSQGGS